MSEQIKRPTTKNREAWKEYWTANRMPWRTEPEIDEERQRFLTEHRSITPDFRKGQYPFRGIQPPLNRADLEWLLATHESKGMKGPVDWSVKAQHKRWGLDLRGADLTDAGNLNGLPLARTLGGLEADEWGLASRKQREWATIHLTNASLRGAHLEGGTFTQAHLSGAFLGEAYLEQASFRRADMRLVYLRYVSLNGVDLRGADLRQARLSNAKLAGADLRDARLEEADLLNTALMGARLEGVFFDAATNLKQATLAITDQHKAKADTDQRTAMVADIHWRDANLAVMEWLPGIRLGDEQRARALTKKAKPKTPGASRKERTEAAQAHRTTLRNAWRDAARANRQIATAMRDQGMSTEANYFAYRAQLCQRQVFRQQKQRARWLGSLLLDLISGYGYLPIRSLIAYLLMIGGFALAYCFLGATVNPPLGVHDAIVFSVTSFHGRGFSPGEAVTLHDPITTLAAGEAVLGLLIEITFIATFTQRFFAR